MPRRQRTCRYAISLRAVTKNTDDNDNDADDKDDNNNNNNNRITTKRKHAC